MSATRHTIPSTLVAPPRAGGHLCTRTFIPRNCHAAIGVLGAVSVATAAALPGSIVEGIARVPVPPSVWEGQTPASARAVTLED